jgi:hypothetical protein
LPLPDPRAVLALPIGDKFRDRLAGGIAAAFSVGRQALVEPAQRSARSVTRRPSRPDRRPLVERTVQFDFELVERSCVGD